MLLSVEEKDLHVMIALAVGPILALVVMGCPLLVSVKPGRS
jgi:hypothetical protein